jgi:hypothetical protein
MSSTNRSKARDSHIADYYVTPVASILDFFMEFWSDNPQLDFSAKKVLDPCAGGDANHPMSYPEAIKKYDFDFPPTISTTDIRPDSLAAVKVDYLLYDVTNKYDVIITNPPFNIAMDVIKKALTDVKPGGLVIMLLRLNFFGSRERSEWFQKFMPTWCYVHSKRMKFLNTGGTDSIEYMHAVWVCGSYPRFTQLRVI